MNAYLKLDHIDKHFDRAGARTEVLKDINLVIDKGEFVSIIGHSGCGRRLPEPFAAALAHCL